MRVVRPDGLHGHGRELHRAASTRMGAQALGPMVDFIYGGRGGCGRTISQLTAADWRRLAHGHHPRARGRRGAHALLGPAEAARPATTELVLATPRVGFMTTPAFFANWPTNTSNSYRVTTNQALIVALGAQLRRPRHHRAGHRDQRRRPARPAGHGLLRLPPDAGPDARLLPPELLARLLEQLAKPAQGRIPADGDVHASTASPVTGTGVGGAGRAPGDAPALRARLDAEALPARQLRRRASTSDPEFLRVADASRRAATTSRRWCASCSRRRWSPSPSGPRPPTTRASAIGHRAPRDRCARRWRTGWALADVCCGLQAARRSTAARAAARPRSRNLALSIPGAGYARGDDEPLLPHDPNLFFTAGHREPVRDAGRRSWSTPGTASRFASADRPTRRSPTSSAPSWACRRATRAPPSCAGVLTEHYAEALAAGTARAGATRCGRRSSWPARRPRPSRRGSVRRNTMDVTSTRRSSSETLFGAGYAGPAGPRHRAAASRFLRGRSAAFGQDACTCADTRKAQYLIVSTSSAGDPLNANVPGTYDFPDIAHAADPRMAATPLQAGRRQPCTAAQRLVDAAAEGARSHHASSTTRR